MQDDTSRIDSAFAVLLPRSCDLVSAASSIRCRIQCRCCAMTSSDPAAQVYGRRHSTEMSVFTERNAIGHTITAAFTTAAFTASVSSTTIASVAMWHLARVWLPGATSMPLAGLTSCFLFYASTILVSHSLLSVSGCCATPVPPGVPCISYVFLPLVRRTRCSPRLVLELQALSESQLDRRHSAIPPPCVAFFPVLSCSVGGSRVTRVPSGALCSALPASCS